MHRLRRKLGLEPLAASGRLFGPGELRLALLSLLSERQSHGYELMTRLEERCAGAYQASAGAIYPTLSQLEDERLVKVEEHEGRKVYEPSAQGKRELEAHARELEQIWSRVRARAEWGVLSDPHAAEVVGPALRLAKSALKVIAHSHGDAAIIDEVRAILDGAREQVERLRKRRAR
jgi:DNA-binding PadR family transcriptional regulator